MYKTILAKEINSAKAYNKNRRGSNRFDLTKGSKDFANIRKAAANTFKDKVRLHNFSSGKTNSYMKKR